MSRNHCLTRYGSIRAERATNQLPVLPLAAQDLNQPALSIHVVLRSTGSKTKFDPRRRERLL